MPPLPHLIAEYLNWSFMSRKCKDLAGAIEQYTSCLMTRLLANIASPKHVLQPGNECTNLPPTCKSLSSFYSLGSSLIPAELSYLGP